MTPNAAGPRSLLLLAALLLAVLASGCSSVQAYLAGLIPRDLEYDMVVEPRVPEGRGDMWVDLEDSAFVYSHEGVFVRVRHLSADELDRRLPTLFDGRHVNPYTYAERDPDLRYVPPRFTVFEVTVVNETYPKVEFDPAKALLVLPDGDRLHYYDPARSGEGIDVLGGNRFSEYYNTELGRSGMEKDLALERIGMVYKTAYHRHRPVFRNATHGGLVAYDPISQSVDQLTLRVRDFVLRFDASGNPQETVDIEFPFDVSHRVYEVTQTDSLADPTPLSSPSYPPY